MQYAAAVNAGPESPLNNRNTITGIINVVSQLTSKEYDSKYLGLLPARLSKSLKNSPEVNNIIVPISQIRKKLREIK